MSHTPRCSSILVVEDEEDIRESLVDALTLEGFRVTTAKDGKEALDLLLKSPVAWRPCFILLDLMMPGMNGWEFLLVQRATPEIADIPVMICSAVADRTRFPGIVNYIRKPLDLHVLVREVSKHCDPGLNQKHAD